MSEPLSIPAEPFTGEGGTFTILIRERPLAKNTVVASNRWKVQPEIKRWVERGRIEMLQVGAQLGLPKHLGTIELEARQIAKDGRWHQDIGACAPAVEAVLDGIVLAGYLPDDRYPFVTKKTYHPPVIGGFDALQVDVHWSGEVPM